MSTENESTAVAEVADVEDLPETRDPATPEEATDLVRFAIEKDVSVDVLERLVALQERVTERNARASFFDALANFQEQCPEVPKNGEAKIRTKSGSTFGYSYAKLEDITRTIRPILREEGLSYSWDTVPGDNPGVLNVVCILRHVEGHETRSTFPVPTETEAAMSAAQKNGAALTYGRRQSLVAVLGLTSSEDVDGAGIEQATIGPEDIRELNERIEEIREAGAGFDLARFCDYLEVDTLDQLPASQFSTAVQALRQKLQKAQEKDPEVKEAYDRAQRIYQHLLNADKVDTEDAERLDGLYEDQDLEGLIKETERLKEMLSDIEDGEPELFQ